MVDKSVTYIKYGADDATRDSVRTTFNPVMWGDDTSLVSGNIQSVMTKARRHGVNFEQTGADTIFVSPLDSCE